MTDGSSGRHLHGCRWFLGATVSVCALFLALQVPATTTDRDPFGFFQPSLKLRVDDRRQLDRGEPIASIVESEPSEVAVFAAVPIDIDGDRLVAWIRRIEALKKSSHVLAIGRFSDPPRIEDLATLSLDEDDVSAIRSCKPGDCSLKLTESEMAELQRVAAGAGQDGEPMLQQAFRAMVLQRVNAYLAGGLAVLPPYADHGGGEASTAANFASVLSHSVFLSEHVPGFAEHLGRYPEAPMQEVESFVYWSKERLARKPIISATHVSIVRSMDDQMPDALVTGEQIFATHYINASLGVTAIIRGEAGAHNYLAYLNRSKVDVLGGMFSGLVRKVMERRLRTEALDVLRELRRRLESGEPAGVESDGPYKAGP
jgi:hypothetical protein